MFIFDFGAFVLNINSPFYIPFTSNETSTAVQLAYFRYSRYSSIPHLLLPTKSSYLHSIHYETKYKNTGNYK